MYICMYMQTKCEHTNVIHHVFNAEIVFLKHCHNITILLKAQDENFFSQFVTEKVVTPLAYGDCNTIQEKAELVMMKITSHLAADDPDSFMTLLTVMQRHGDRSCEKRAKHILEELSNYRQPSLPGTVHDCTIKLLYVVLFLYR